MFTLMQERSDGTQTFYKALQVQYYPKTPENGDCGGVHGYRGPDEDKDAWCGVLKEGRVFLMNEQGATVGRFYLDTPEPPPRQ